MEKCPEVRREVYSDPSTGNLIYICETGSLAVIAEDPAAKVTGDAKAFDHLHGLDLKGRRFDEYQFGKGTKKVGVELYRDNNNGNLIYLTEVGTLTVTPGPKGLKAPTKAPTDPKWAHAFNLRCRKVGEGNCSATTPGPSAWKCFAMTTWASSCISRKPVRWPASKLRDISAVI